MINTNDEISGKVVETTRKEEEFPLKLIDVIEEKNGERLISRTEIYKADEWELVNMVVAPLWDKEMPDRMIHGAVYDNKTYKNVTHHSIMRIDPNGLHLYRHNVYDENNNLVYSC